MDAKLNSVLTGKLVFLAAIIIAMNGCAFNHSRTWLSSLKPGSKLWSDEFQSVNPDTVNELLVKSTDVFPVFVVSGRNLSVDAKNSIDPFGVQRNHQAILGIARVSVNPPVDLSGRIKAKIKRPLSKPSFRIIETQIGEQPYEDPWLLKDVIKRGESNPWIRAIRKQLIESKTRKVCIYVHGYNTNYADNTLTAAELYSELGSVGAMLSFEWPSEAKALSYLADKGNANYSTRHFRGLVSNIAKECDADSITIIAHSAGSPIVVNALREIRLIDFDLGPAELRNKYRIDRVVLAAPDMDSMTFVNAIRDGFSELIGGCAVYASAKDKALLASKFLYQSDRLGRSVGELEPWEIAAIHKATNIEMINASSSKRLHIPNLKYSHSYFHTDVRVSTDIQRFIAGETAITRGLRRQGEEIFWKF